MAAGSSNGQLGNTEDGKPATRRRLNLKEEEVNEEKNCGAPPMTERPFN